MSKFVITDCGIRIPVDLYGKFGTCTLFPKEDFFSFEEARDFVQKLNLKNNKEWNIYVKSGKKPKNIPSSPNDYYKDNGWINWYDFLGTAFLLFEEVKDFVRSLHLKSAKEWNIYRKSGKKPDNIPTNPNQFYKDKGWVSWGDFLGTDNVYKKDFLSYKESRKIIRKLNLKSLKQWYKHCKSGKRPDNIPFSPDQVYKDKGWVSWGDFLGTDNVHKKDFLSYEEARDFVIELDLKGQKEWREYCKSGKRPNNIPANPNAVYRNKGWVGLGDFLGKNK